MAQKSTTAKQRFSTFGRTTLKKLNKMRIYVQGLSKVGADLVTNLVLLNPQTLTLFDRDVIQLADCYNTFHYPKQQANKTFRTDCLIDICRKINKKVVVKKLDQQLQPEDAHKFDLLVFCDVYDIDRVIRIDTLLRESNLTECGVIFAGQMGFYGYMFTDFGEGFKMMNTGKHLPVLLIEEITNEEEGRVTVNREFKHGFRHGDFIRIDGVEGMKEVNGDARPVKILDQYTFVIESTKHYGKYIKGGIAQKVKMTEKIPFANLKTQIIDPIFKQDQNKNSNQLLMLATSAILSFYQNNSKIPELFSQNDENQAYDNAMQINKKKVNVNETLLRSIFKTCSYGFYPLIRLMAAIVSLECVKKTGKYTPLPTPYFVNWYDKISFEIKKKVEGQYLNIIETDLLEKMSKLQVGIIDDGAQSLELFNVLFSCQIAQSRKMVLFGLQTLQQKQMGDPLVLKAHIKFDVSRQLFKNRKMQSLPCSLSFSNDLMLSQAWNRIRVLINASQQMSEYIYDNIVYNEIDLIDCQFSDLRALLRTCVRDRSRLRDNVFELFEEEALNMPNEYKYAVEWAVDVFKLLFIQMFEDVRCFVVMGANYFHKVQLDAKRKRIFFLLLSCLEEGGHIEPENIVKISKAIFMQFFQEETKLAISSHNEGYWTGYHKKPTMIDLDLKDALTQEFLTSTYLLISWFFCRDKGDPKKVNNAFTQYLYKIDDAEFTDQQRQNFALSKAKLLSRISIPYTSLLELYKMDSSVQFIWHASRLRSKIFGVEEEITTKKFFRFYNRKTRPCPFVHQIITSYLPLAVISMLKSQPKNLEVDVLENRISDVKSQKPQPAPIRQGRLVPEGATQWTLIVIQGPKKIEQLLDRFRTSQGVQITRIKHDQKLIFQDRNFRQSRSSKTPSTSTLIQDAIGEKRTDYELIMEGIDIKTKQPCTICKTKYILQG